MKSMPCFFFLAHPVTPIGRIEAKVQVDIYVRCLASQPYPGWPSWVLAVRHVYNLLTPAGITGGELAPAANSGFSLAAA
jgi:hypothetical protein